MFNVNNLYRILISTLILSLFCNKASCMDAPTVNTITRTTANTEGPSLKITYESSLPLLVTEGIRDVRSMEEKAREMLFQRMAALLPREGALGRINRIQNPQVILWFTNYFGKVSKATLAWYRENIMSKVPKSTFWLTDLKAWRLLSTGKNELRGALVDRLMAGQQLNPAECPLLCESTSDMVDVAINRIPSYKLLSSKAFFEWLLAVKDQSLLPDEICIKLRRNNPLESSLPCSLSALGYRPELLNRSLDLFQNEQKINMLDIEFSLIYPILQYLEGIYYAALIIEANMLQLLEGKDISIVLLLPNKEFTYFAVPEEQECFGSFQEGIQKAIAHYKGQIWGSITISIEPFAYGNDFYDAPYQLTTGGLYRRKTDFLAALQKKY